MHEQEVVPTLYGPVFEKKIPHAGLSLSPKQADRLGCVLPFAPTSVKFDYYRGRLQASAKCYKAEMAGQEKQAEG